MRCRRHARGHFSGPECHNPDDVALRIVNTEGINLPSVEVIMFGACDCSRDERRTCIYI